MELFIKEINRLKLGMVETTGDFQCDQTAGCPTVMCWSLSENVIWLEPAKFTGISKEQIEECWKACKEYGFRYCSKTGQYNYQLKTLSQEAYDLYAILPQENEWTKNW